MRPTPQAERGRRRRNLALAWSLAALAVLFFLITIAKMSGGG